MYSRARSRTKARGIPGLEDRARSRSILGQDQELVS